MHRLYNRRRLKVQLFRKAIIESVDEIRHHMNKLDSAYNGIISMPSFSKREKINQLCNFFQKGRGIMVSFFQKGRGKSVFI